MDGRRTEPAISILAGSLVGRTPLLPLHTVGEIWAADATAAIAALVDDPIVAAALTAASPSLAASLRSSSSPLSDRALRAVLTYLTRMATRTTPFGLFAGVGAVAAGQATTLAVAETRRRTSSQLDFGLLGPLVAEVEERMFATGELRVVFNDATIVKGNRLALIPDDRELDDLDAPRLQSLRITATLEHLRALLKAPQRVDAIVAELVNRFAHDEARARDYLRTIWKAGFLISEAALSPNADVGEARFQLARAHPAGGEWIGDVHRRLDRLDGEVLGAAHLDEYRAFAQEVETLAGSVPTSADVERSAADVKRLTTGDERRDDKARSPIMVDLASPFDGKLGANVLVEVATLAELALRGGGRMRLPALTERFGRCFEGWLRFVPLLEAVDACLDLLASGSPESTWEPNASTPQRELLLDELVQRAAAEHRNEIALDAADVDILFPRLPKDAVVPSSMEVGFSIAASSIAAVDAGDFSIVAATMEGTVPAAATTARFFRILSTPTEHGDFVTADDDDVVSAELVYTPRRARLLNVGVRRVPAAYEIGVGTFPSGDAVAIALDDLWIALDERTKCFVVRSNRLGKRVRIIETTALNPLAAAPPAALLLSLISRAEMIVPSRFAWTSRTAYAYRPRLRYGRIVLRPATWQFDKDQLARDGLAKLGACAAMPCPRFVALVVRDQRLLVDAQSALGDEIVRDQLRKITSSVVTFEESPLSFPCGWLRGVGGAYHAEFTVSAEVAKALSPATTTVAGGRVELASASSRGGDDWLYLRLYDSPHRFDFVLRHALTPLMDHARQHGVASFFLRYNDPEPHLRLRFHVDPDTDVGRELARLARALEQTAGIRRVGFDRYEPEVERYGGVAALRACEQIFCVSSALALRTIAASPLPEERTSRAAGDLAVLFFAVVSDDVRAAAIEALRPSREMSRLDAAQRTALRQLRTGWNAGDGPSPWSELDLDATREALANASLPIGDILASLNHMHANRLGLHGLAERRLHALLWHFVFGRTQESPR
jgi:thiopeptide-type bacteriocin biosynthesis protein